MKQTDNQAAAAALKTANPTTTNHTNTHTPRRRYEVSETTAMLIDCITDVSDIYDKIIAALATKYGMAEAESDARSLKYLYACNQLSELLQDEIQKHFTDCVLMDAKNSHADIVRV